MANRLAWPSILAVKRWARGVPSTSALSVALPRSSRPATSPTYGQIRSINAEATWTSRDPGGPRTGR